MQTWQRAGVWIVHAGRPFSSLFAHGQEQDLPGSLAIHPVTLRRSTTPDDPLRLANSGASGTAHTHLTMKASSFVISRLRDASSPAVYASRRALPHAMQDSLPAGGLRLCRAGVEPAGSLREVSGHRILLSRASPGAISVQVSVTFIARRPQQMHVLSSYGASLEFRKVQHGKPVMGLELHLGFFLRRGRCRGDNWGRER